MRSEREKDELRAEVERLQRIIDQHWEEGRERNADNERLQASLDACADYGDKQCAEIERLRADFLYYGRHKEDCTGGDGTICACGYLQTYTALETKP